MWNSEEIQAEQNFERAFHKKQGEFSSVLHIPSSTTTRIVPIFLPHHR